MMGRKRPRRHWPTPIPGRISFTSGTAGYIQAYDPHAWPGHHFADQPPWTRGVDQYIGEADLLNQGHGPAFIRQFCDELIAKGAPVVVTDPHPNNSRAIRAYEKAGFSRYGGPVETDWGRCLLMARRA
jgi:aminoglycoside 6'-N-acetyltransferase